jgi:hypothetical protein
MVNNSQITINATTFLVNVGRFTTKARKNVTILVNDTSASYYIILCRYFTTRARGISHRHRHDDDEICVCADCHFRDRHFTYCQIHCHQ